MFGPSAALVQVASMPGALCRCDRPSPGQGGFTSGDLSPVNLAFGEAGGPCLTIVCRSIAALTGTAPAGLWCIVLLPSP